MSETTVTPTVNDSGAGYVVKLGGVTDADGVITLGVGSNVIAIEVTAEDDATTRTYTVTVTRAEPPSTDATLKGLTLSGVDFGTFDSTTTSYTAQVANSVSQTTVTPAVNDSGASHVIKLGGVTEADGVVTLSVGSNVITVEVTAEDDGTTRTYTVTVTRAEPPSTDATLSALVLSDVDFGTFASGTTSYTAQAANDVAQTTVTPTVNDSGASHVIKLGGVTDADGVVVLSVGGNVITVEVTAEDDSTTRTYTVTVTRAEPPTPELSDDATLSALTLSAVDFGIFDSTTTSYTAQVANSVSQTTVTPTLNDLGASYVIKLDGVTDVDGVISLAVGSNVITIEVTAEDDSTTQTYTVTITRAEPPSTDATLSALTLSGVDFGTFASGTTSYSGPGGQWGDADDGDRGRKPVRSELRHQAGRRDGLRRRDPPQRGQQRHHHRGDRRGRQHHRDLHHNRHTGGTGLDGRHTQRPGAQRDGLRHIRLDNHFLHRAGGQQRVADDGDRGRKPVRSELRHQARRHSRLRRRDPPQRGQQRHND